MQAGAEKLPFPDESFDAAVNVPAARCGDVDFHARGTSEVGALDALAVVDARTPTEPSTRYSSRK